MNRRNFLKTAAVPLVLGAIGVKLTETQTFIPADQVGWHPEYLEVDALWEPGDIIHVPRTAESFKVESVTAEGIKLERGFGGLAPPQAIEPDDPVWLIGPTE